MNRLSRSFEGLEVVVGWVIVSSSLALEKCTFNLSGEAVMKGNDEERWKFCGVLAGLC